VSYSGRFKSGKVIATRQHTIAARAMEAGSPGRDQHPLASGWRFSLRRVVAVARTANGKGPWQVRRKTAPAQGWGTSGDKGNALKLIGTKSDRGDLGARGRCLTRMYQWRGEVVAAILQRRITMNSERVAEFRTREGNSYA